jgi:hypothetical protein
MWKNRLRAILPLALDDEWDIRQNGLPKIRANLRLAINSLSQQLPNFWDKPEEIEELIALPRNAGVRKILSQFSDTEIAFAIRDARK